jgi:uncharacterized protein (DUF3084 family)
MFLIDDLFLAPFRGLKFVAEAVHDAAREEIQNERRALRDEINDLYMQLETGEITEEQFEQREEEILDRLEALEATESELEEGRAAEADEASEAASGDADDSADDADRSAQTDA